MSPGSSLPRYRLLFANPEFSALFTAQVISLLGDVVAAVTLTVLVYAETGSAALAALTFSLVFLPYLFAGVLLSSLVDRLPARAMLVGCNLLSALIVAVMAAADLPVAALLALLFLLGLIAPLFAGVRAATLPDVLPDEPSFVLGRSLLRLAAQLTQVAGNLLGGLLLLVLTPRGALTVDAISFAVAALLLRLGVRKRSQRVAKSGLPVLRDSLAGLRSILGQPGSAPSASFSPLCLRARRSPTSRWPATSLCTSRCASCSSGLRSPLCHCCSLPCAPVWHLPWRSSFSPVSAAPTCPVTINVCCR